jgi:tRNA modification GTPase
MRDTADTICALSTPPGRSGVAVVRVSGPSTFTLFEKIFLPNRKRGSIPFRSAALGRIIDPRSGTEIDEGIAICYKAPRSYTGQDMCEFSLHGSPVLVSALIECLCAMDARIAEPGEFTMRAFLNGRMDLTQAEAVRDIIDSATLYQAQIAGRQRAGSVAEQIKPIRALLIDIIVNFESGVEFAEENLSTASRESVTEIIQEARQKLNGWTDSFRTGRIIREGFSIAVVGRPNVGKSSLFNTLLTQDRSIVDDVPGTTRDLVSEITSMGGIPVRLVDTAGIHGSGGFIERLGMDRSKQAIADADAVVMVVDGSCRVYPEDIELRKEMESLRCFLAINKCDLPSAWSGEEKNKFAGDWHIWDVSAKTKMGIAQLRTGIIEMMLGNSGTVPDGMLVTNLRQCNLLRRAEENLARAARAIGEGVSEEYVLIDLRKALEELGEITGETGVEDLLGEIFSRFCIGK